MAELPPPTNTTSSNAIAVDSAGDLYVAGYTTSTNFPTRSAFAPPPAKANPNGGQSWAFVTKFAPDARTVIFSTYIGGSTNNSILELVFGYNGVGRLTGSDNNGAVGGRGGTTAGGGFSSGETGLTRLFGTDMGSQISWLLPAL